MDFNIEGQGVHFLISGWSITEDWGTWSDGPIAELQWPLGQVPYTSAKIRLSVRLFPEDPTVPQSAKILINGVEVSSLRRHGQGDIHGLEFKVPKDVLFARYPMHITFHISNPIQPLNLTDSQDGRFLGIGLKRIKIEFDAEK